MVCIPNAQKCFPQILLKNGVYLGHRTGVRAVLKSAVRLGHKFFVRRCWGLETSKWFHMFRFYEVGSQFFSFMKWLCNLNFVGLKVISHFFHFMSLKVAPQITPIILKARSHVCAVLYSQIVVVYPEFFQGG